MSVCKVARITAEHGGWGDHGKAPGDTREEEGAREPSTLGESWLIGLNG